MTCWNVISAGPSGMRAIDRSLFLDGPIVAVNAAVGVHPYADYYACIETPNALARKLGMLNVSPPKLAKEYGATWWVVRWQYEKHPKEWGFKTEFPARPHPWKGAIDWNSDSLTFALNCALNKGATNIRVFGADHSGDDPLKPGWVHPQSSWEDRWAVESERFRTLVAEAAERGIRIEKCNADVCVREQGRGPDRGSASDEQHPEPDSAQGGVVQARPGVRGEAGSDGPGIRVRHALGSEVGQVVAGGRGVVRQARPSRASSQARRG